MFFVIVLNYVYFYFLHKVYGRKLYDVKKSNGKLSFKTRKSQYQLDESRQKLLFKNKKDKQWNALTFDQITGIHFERKTATASLIEFFFGDFTLFDFMRKYRDRLHTCDIKLRVDSDHPDINMDVTILGLKQYEQREFFLGQLLHDFNIWLMTKLGFYSDIDDVTKKDIKQIREIFTYCGLKLNKLSDVRAK